MQNNDTHESTNPSRRGVISAGAIAALASQFGLPAPASGAEAKPKPMLMFVQMSEGFKHD